jgi:hypothetical protein
MISGLLLLERLSLLLLSITQVILLLLVHFVACAISCARCRLVSYGRQVRRMRGSALFGRRRYGCF